MFSGGRPQHRPPDFFNALEVAVVTHITDDGAVATQAMDEVTLIRNHHPAVVNAAADPDADHITGDDFFTGNLAETTALIQWLRSPPGPDLGVRCRTPSLARFHA